MTMRPRVLVVEDESAIRMGICDVLVFHGYQVDGVGRGDEGLEAALSGEYQLLVLDVMLPGIDGLTICRRARSAYPQLAILMLTARGSERDILEGFSSGADDYVTKPFSVAQFIARVEALMRRCRLKGPRSFELGAVVVDVETHQARQGDRMVELTPRNVELLAYFAGSPQRILSRAELLKEVWGYQRVDGIETRCVDMHIAKLRKKLASLGSRQIIETVRGAGYRWSGNSG